jgi:DNA polymerase III epsilon subunit-like protein
VGVDLGPLARTVPHPLADLLEADARLGREAGERVPHNVRSHRSIKADRIDEGGEQPSEFPAVALSRCVLVPRHQHKARRLVPGAPNHKLGDLARYLGLRMPVGMRAHRARSDMLMACQLWNHLRGTMRQRLGGRESGLDVIRTMMRMPKAKVEVYLDAIGRG